MGWGRGWTALIGWLRKTPEQDEHQRWRIKGQRGIAKVREVRTRRSILGSILESILGFIMHPEVAKRAQKLRRGRIMKKTLACSYDILSVFVMFSLKLFLF